MTLRWGQVGRGNAISQSCPANSYMVAFGRLSRPNHSNPLSFPFLLLLCRKSGSGRSLWQPCRGSLLAKACVSLEVSEGGFPGLALASYHVSHQIRGRGVGILAVPSRGLETPVRTRGASVPEDPLQGRHFGIHGGVTAENKPSCRSASLGISQTGGFLSRDVIPALIPVSSAEPTPAQGICPGSRVAARWPAELQAHAVLSGNATA